MPIPRQTEYEEEYEQEQEPMKGHKDSRCLRCVAGTEDSQAFRREY